jgi:Cupin domain
VRCIRIVSEDGGPSRFEDVDVALAAVGYAPPAPAFEVSDPVAASAMLLATLPVGYTSDWHPSPARQWFLVLSGELEVEIGAGGVRRFSAGAALLVEDVTGPGHRTRVVGDVPVRGAFVRLAG